MIINDPNGKPLKITSDGRAQVVSVTQTDINALASIGKAWTLPFTQAAADATAHAGAADAAVSQDPAGRRPGSPRRHPGGIAGQPHPGGAADGRRQSRKIRNQRR